MAFTAAAAAAPPLSSSAAAAAGAASAFSGHLCLTAAGSRVEGAAAANRSTPLDAAAAAMKATIAAAAADTPASLAAAEASSGAFSAACRKNEKRVAGGGAAADNCGGGSGSTGCWAQAAATSNSSSSTSGQAESSAGCSSSSRRNSWQRGSSSSRSRSASSSVSSSVSSSSSEKEEEEGGEKQRGGLLNRIRKKGGFTDEEEDSADEEVLALPPIECLFCTYTATEIECMYTHMRQQHGLDLATRSRLWRCLPTDAAAAAADAPRAVAAAAAATVEGEAAALLREAQQEEAFALPSSVAGLTQQQQQQKQRAEQQQQQLRNEREQQQKVERRQLQQQETKEQHLQQAERAQQQQHQHEQGKRMPQQQQEQQQQNNTEGKEGGELPALTSYRRIALINFLRSVGPDEKTRAAAAAKGRAANCCISFDAVLAAFASLSAAAACWRDPQYLLPVVADDRLLWEGCCLDASSGSSIEDSDDEKGQQQLQQQQSRERQLQHQQPDAEAPHQPQQKKEEEEEQQQREVMEARRTCQQEKVEEQDRERQLQGVKLLQPLQKKKQRQQRQHAAASGFSPPCEEEKQSSTSSGEERDASGVVIRSRTPEERSYFAGYSEVYIHREMIADRPRTEAYRNFILNNGDLFRGKVVLDVGCGSGILSMFCAQAGASLVVGVDAAAGIARLAQRIVAANGFSDQIQIINSKLEDVELVWTPGEEGEATTQQRRRVTAVPRRQKFRRTALGAAAARAGKAAAAAAAEGGGRRKSSSSSKGCCGGASTKEDEEPPTDAEDLKKKKKMKGGETAGKSRPATEKIKVDIIVSEWMGYCLLFESMIYTVLRARDEYLKPGGLLVPSRVALGVAAADFSAEVAQQRGHFCDKQQTYGLDLRQLHLSDAQLLACPNVCVVGPEKLLSSPRLCCAIDLHSVSPRSIQQLRFPFRIPLSCSSTRAAGSGGSSSSRSCCLQLGSLRGAACCSEPVAPCVATSPSVATSLVVYFDCFFERHRSFPSAASPVADAAVNPVSSSAPASHASDIRGASATREPAVVTSADGIHYYDLGEEKEQQQQEAEKQQQQQIQRHQPLSEEQKQRQEQRLGEEEHRGSVLLSTSPCSTPTHWKQTLLHLLGTDRRLLRLRPEAPHRGAAQEHHHQPEGRGTDVATREKSGNMDEREMHKSLAAVPAGGTPCTAAFALCTENLAVHPFAGIDSDGSSQAHSPQLRTAACVTGCGDLVGDGWNANSTAGSTPVSVVAGDEGFGTASASELRGVLSISPGKGEKHRSIAIVVELHDVPHVDPCSGKVAVEPLLIRSFDCM